MMVKNYRPASAGMLPALPGTYLVTAYFDDNQVDLVKCNVLGWSVSTERTLTPLVLDLRAAEEDPWHVIQPDGRVECSDGRNWSTVDSWIADERRRRRARAGTTVDELAAAAQQPKASPAPIPSGMGAPQPAPQSAPQAAPVNGSRAATPYGSPVL